MASPESHKESQRESYSVLTQSRVTQRIGNILILNPPSKVTLHSVRRMAFPTGLHWKHPHPHPTRGILLLFCLGPKWREIVAENRQKNAANHRCS